MNCNNCGSSEIYTDSARGAVYCGECGMVQEENTIVSTLQFDNTSEKTTLHGQIISVENTNIGTNYVDSSFYIKNTISSICIKMSLGEHHVESAFRWYKLCLQYSLSKGKLLLYTLSACVYITCRQVSTPHLLIDFSNSLRIDMFKIGRLFLKLRALFGIDIPLMDPSLYMHRFVSHLKFKNRNILEYSVRLVDRMKKDWILTGRRPNNTCGAALLIASRIFEEERDISEIARAVHASPATISKRLKEMADTRTADLDINEFKTNWIETEENPPVSRPKKRRVKRKKTGDCLTEDEIIEMCVYSVPKDVMGADSPDEANDAAEDDFDVDNQILTAEEVEWKRVVWEEMYGDYEIEVAKKRKVKMDRQVRVKRVKRRYNFESMEEAYKALDKKVSSKLNYSAIKDLFEFNLV